MRTKVPTPGPWKAGEGSFYKPIYAPAIADDWPIAWVDFDNEADYILTLAAPKMLAALKALYALHEPEGRFQPHHFKPILRQVAEALAAAEPPETGESK